MSKNSILLYEKEFIADNSLLERGRATRRSILAGLGTFLAAGCGGDGGVQPGSSGVAVTLPGANSAIPVPAATPTAGPPGEAVLVSAFYKHSHGMNLQPAFQAAIDEAARSEKTLVYNDLEISKGEMWAPIRTSTSLLAADGIPLVVRAAVELDFAGLEIFLRGPTGGDRRQNVTVEGEPWLGGWLYVVGNSQFGKISVKNVKVDGGFIADFMRNELRVLNDKGFRIQDSDVEEVHMSNVEMKNFGGEIYYIGGNGPKVQTILNCHFHGSPQSAWNGCSTGELYAENLKAGNAYLAAEILGGKGQTYKNCEFYDCQNMGFFGGPSPGFTGLPYWYAFWDGVAKKPSINFDGVKFTNCQQILIGSWVYGTVQATDAPITLWYGVGDLHDIDLEVSAIIDRMTPYAAVNIGGPNNLITRCPDTPEGTYYALPHDINIIVKCGQSPSATAAGRSMNFGLGIQGGLLAAETIKVSISGSAKAAWGFVAPRHPDFVAPVLVTTGFTPVG